MVEKLADILGGIEHGIGRTVRLCGLLNLWEEIVDERVRRNASALKIRNRTLYISTSSPAWAQELSFLKKEIIQKFNEKAGKEAISDVKFRSGCA